MGQNSNIEWTDNTFNPWVGCFKVSPGCKHCYAEELMTRKGRWANTWGPPETTERIRTSDDNWRKPLKWDRQAQKDGKRVKVFCSSLADVFEDNTQLKSWRLDLFMLISDTPYLDWQILTKRPEFARTFFEQHPGFLLPNVWIGTSVEDQKRADERIPELLKIPAAIRFLSVEPLLGPVDLSGRTVEGVWIDQEYADLDYGLGEVIEREGWPIHWVIVGGESGPDARPMHPDWARAIRDQCTAAGVAFHFKQWGGWVPNSQYPPAQYNPGDLPPFIPGAQTKWSSDLVSYKVGKHAAGRLLDGRTWDEMPAAAPANR